MAAALQKPDDARARPMTILGTSAGYGSVFDVEAKRELFLSCILLDRRVSAYLSGRDDLLRDTKNDIRFYMDTWLASRLTGEIAPTKAAIASLADTLKGDIPTEMLKECCDAITTIYAAHGADANAAKGGEMVKTLLKQLGEANG